MCGAPSTWPHIAHLAKHCVRMQGRLLSSCGKAHNGRTALNASTTFRVAKTFASVSNGVSVCRLWAAQTQRTDVSLEQVLAMFLSICYAGRHGHAMCARKSSQQMETCAGIADRRIAQMRRSTFALPLTACLKLRGPMHSDAINVLAWSESHVVDAGSCSEEVPISPNTSGFVIWHDAIHSKHVCKVYEYDWFRSQQLFKNSHFFHSTDVNGHIRSYTDIAVGSSALSNAQVHDLCISCSMVRQSHNEFLEIE